MKWSVNFRDVMYFRGVWERSSFQNRRKPIATCLSDTVLIADALGTSNQTSQSFSHLPLGMPRPYSPCTICPTACLFGMFMSNWKAKQLTTRTNTNKMGPDFCCSKAHLGPRFLSKKPTRMKWSGSHKQMGRLKAAPTPKKNTRKDPDGWHWSGFSKKNP